jgi:hypothetical protein
VTFLAAIAYHNAQTRAHTGAATFSAMPWYFQTLAGGTACLIAAGWQRSRIAARPLAPTLLLLTTHLLTAA